MPPKLTDKPSYRETRKALLDKKEQERLAKNARNRKYHSNRTEEIKERKRQRDRERYHKKAASQTKKQEEDEAAVKREKHKLSKAKWRLKVNILWI